MLVERGAEAEAEAKASACVVDVVAAGVATGVTGASSSLFFFLLFFLFSLAAASRGDEAGTVIAASPAGEGAVTAPLVFFTSLRASEEKKRLPSEMKKQVNS